MQNVAVKYRDGILRKKRAKVLSYVWLLSLFLAFVFTLVFVKTNYSIEDRREVSYLESLGDIRNAIDNELGVVGTDLHYISSSVLTKSTLEEGDETAKAYLTSLMFQVGALHDRYSQIRVLDKYGQEVVRIDQLPDTTLFLIPDDKLQKKANRYYFRDALELESGEVYTSKFDLNIENGKVEKPIKPTIRFSSPVRQEDGTLLGVTVINYNGEKLLKLIDRSNRFKGNPIYLINKEGYYLKEGEAEKEWGFMFDSRKEVRFSHDYPEIWRQLTQTNIGKFVSDDGEYYAVKLELKPGGVHRAINAEEVYLVQFVSNAYVTESQGSLIYGLVILGLFLVPLLAFLAYKLAISQVEREYLLNELVFEASHDPLTELYNRRAIIEQLQRNIQLSRRRHSEMAVSFIDVNDLKMTNDHFGHDAGDEMIVGLATSIRQTVRGSDLAARIGGDEFLIVFDDCDVSEANFIMERIQKKYADLGKEAKNTTWHFSYGCAQLQANDTPESLIERADKIMYKYKQAYKQSQHLG
ncbi:sensor domain-containing diguanylate cyclase [Vibrio proteolyticus]|uniref:diguanylate cyclase n=1 Tax=Vibrio proteolyticus NBRC 13287 TaxID=1219065 RepID=U3BPN0_VIBPR|nr:sensor domain-containing diguanylate cyclase [Vibrio proteolyticus]GAD68498.1 hypothetical protein VPR01S_15_00160 [Vibrio proteolyticus NBRC 13287]